MLDLDLKERKIMVVDDERVNRDLMAAYLMEAGYNNVCFAEEGGESVARVAEDRPDLVLLDIMLPGLDGYEVCRRLKSDAETATIPVIMVTALGDRDSRLRALEGGADDFLNKPLDPAELVARVNSLVRVKAYLDRLQEYNARLVENLKTAQRIQYSLLPRQFPVVEGLFFDAYFKPTEFLGGDYYNVFEIDDEHICAYVADVSGHNLDAALLTVFIKETVDNYFRRQHELRGEYDPRDCLRDLEQTFQQENFPEDLFITVFLGILHRHNWQFTYSSAGMVEFPCWFDPEGVEELYCPGSLIMALGLHGEYRQEAVQIEPGQGVLLYSDGVVEQVDASREEEFGRERLQKSVQRAMNTGTGRHVVSAVVDGLRRHAAGDQFDDDVTLLCIYRES